MNAEEVRRFCTSLPGATEDIKWEKDLCFLVGDKMFTVIALDGSTGMSFKVKEEQFYQLIEQDDFTPAPYLGRYKWVYTTDFTQLPDEQLKQFIQDSYQLIKAKLPKKIQNQIKDL